MITTKQTKMFLSLVTGLQLIILVFFCNKENETFKNKITEYRTFQQKKLFYINSFIHSFIVCRCGKSMCGCVGSAYMYGYGYVPHKPQNIYEDKKDKLQKLVLFFHHLGPVNRTQIIRLGNKCFHVLYNLPGSENVF